MLSDQINGFKKKIEGKAMNRNRYNYPTPPIIDIKGKEIQTRNNYTLMDTSLAESQTDSYFPTKWPNGYPKQPCKRHTHSKTNYNKNKSWQKNVLGTVSEKYFTWGTGGGGGGRGGRRGGGWGCLDRHT